MDRDQLLAEIAGAWKEEQLTHMNCPFCETELDLTQPNTDRDGHDEGCLWLLLDRVVSLVDGSQDQTPQQASADTRYVYSARCTWNGPIQAVGKLPSGLPCCPQCRSPLFELPSELEWTKAAHAYEREGHTGYASFMTWMRGRCFRGLSRLLDAAQAYQKETGRAVTL